MSESSPRAAQGATIEDHERLLEELAARAATAVTAAQSVADERLYDRIEAAEHERGRWARELRDETLQGLAALRVRLASALQEQSSDALERAGREAIDQIETEIQRLRRMITELRPAALDEIGLEAALRALVARSARQGGLSIDARIELPPDEFGTASAVETTVYRLVQEALMNVLEHSEATQVVLAVSQREGRVSVRIEDDGVGFEPGATAEGFGIRGMRERVTLAGGELMIESAPGGGTALRAVIPAGTSPAVLRARSGRDRGRSGPARSGS
jgi:signal transduction histidine kinase